MLVYEFMPNGTLQDWLYGMAEAPYIFISRDNLLHFSSVASRIWVKNDGAAAGFVFNLETEDVSGAVTKAVGAGAIAEGEISEVEGAGFVAKLKDPYGYIWVISSPAKVTAPVVAADAQA